MKKKKKKKRKKERKKRKSKMVFENSNPFSWGTKFQISVSP